MSRRIDDLKEPFRSKFILVQHMCKLDGVNILVTCTLRTLDEQRILYAQGRTKPGKIVTKAEPGESAHNYGLAADIVLIVDDRICWDVKNPGWAQYGEICKGCGLVWGGSWKFKDLPHCEMPNWRRYI